MRAVAASPCFVALACVAATIAGSPAAAWERGVPAAIATGASGVPLPNDLRSPPFPVLPGVIGPDVAADDGGMPPGEAAFGTGAGTGAAAETAVRNAIEAHVVSPDVATWDRVAEEGTALTGPLPGSGTRDGAEGASLVVLTGAAIIGALAVLGAALGWMRKPMHGEPLSILRRTPADSRMS